MIFFFFYIFKSRQSHNIPVDDNQLNEIVHKLLYTMIQLYSYTLRENEISVVNVMKCTNLSSSWQLLQEMKFVLIQ